MSALLRRSGISFNCRTYSTATNKTFSNQARIPSLPIPSLQSTSNRYKRSLLPLLSSVEYKQAAHKIDRFFKKGGLAESLQSRLLDLDRQETALGLNWLDRLWLQKAYLEYRAPTLINVNWWYQFRDSIDVSQTVVTPEEGQTTDRQLERSARLLFWLVDYSNKVNAELIAPDVTRSGEPFCMHQLKSMFGTSRIAATGSDRVVRQWPCLAKHVNVIYKDQIFHVDVIGEKGEIISVQQLKEQLNDVVKQVEGMDQLQAPIGVLTTEHRDTWGQIREEMEKQPRNAKSLKDIDDSLFVFCLDDYSSPLDLDLSHRNIFHGRNGHNRWFDKALQFIVENNGRAGINGEHSPADAVIPSRIVDYILERESIENTTSIPRVENLKKPQLLAWQVSTKLAESISTAEQNASKLIANLDSVLLHYYDYGSNLMKQASVSPDGWLQMAYQLAYYRLYRKPCPTYESASTRKYLAGRTETVRSCSVESVTFTEKWEDKDIKMTEKLDYLKKAIGCHLEYMKAATNGQGVDRHLLGLRCQMTPDETASEDAAIFEDPSYWGSQYWLLSTSNTSPGNFAWGGFGAVVPEGYGTNYAIGKDHIRMSISSWKECTDTESATFRKSVRDVLDEFGDVAERYLIKK